MGNLLVPQGTVRIQRNQFVYLELDGIELPEGLVEIRAQIGRAHV